MFPSNCEFWATENPSEEGLSVPVLHKCLVGRYRLRLNSRRWILGTGIFLPILAMLVGCVDKLRIVIIVVVLDCRGPRGRGLGGSLRCSAGGVRGTGRAQRRV